MKYGIPTEYGNGIPTEYGNGILPTEYGNGIPTEYGKGISTEYGIILLVIILYCEESLLL